MPSASAAARTSQLTALASSRATVVFPTPRGPEKMYACAMRPLRRAFCNVRRTWSWPVSPSKVWGRYFLAVTW